MGKFFNGRVKKDRTSLVKYGVIGLGILIILILFVVIAVNNGGKKTKDAVLELRKGGVTMEIGGDLPNGEDFFKTIENYDKDDLKVSFDECDTDEIGECTVTISGPDIDDIETTLTIADTKEPEFSLVKELEINPGDEYTANDFVKSCTDNSSEDCIIEFVTTDTDADGNPVDYGAYKENGTYTVKIIARDANGNTSEFQKAKLIIGDGGNSGGEDPVTPVEPPTPAKCDYGDLTVSESRIKFPIAVYVGDKKTNCAINKNLWDDTKTQVPANDLYMGDYSRLKTQMNDMLKEKYPKGANIKVYPSFISVLNDSGKGLVGYGIYVKVYVAAMDEQINKDENIVMSYYLKSDGKRQYQTNKYNIAE